MGGRVAIYLSKVDRVLSFCAKSRQPSGFLWTGEATGGEMGAVSICGLCGTCGGGSDPLCGIGVYDKWVPKYATRSDDFSNVASNDDRPFVIGDCISKRYA